jgi:hypothetical protein
MNFVALEMSYSFISWNAWRSQRTGLAAKPRAWLEACWKQLACARYRDAAALAVSPSLLRALTDSLVSLGQKR